jgi:hypothetical protein
MPARLDPAIAASIMLEAAVESLEPYVSSTAAWRCRCLVCGRKVTPRLTNVRQGHAACVFCARLAVDRALSGIGNTVEVSMREVRANGIAVLLHDPAGRRRMPLVCFRHRTRLSDHSSWAERGEDWHHRRGRFAPSETLSSWLADAASRSSAWRTGSARRKRHPRLLAWRPDASWLEQRDATF